MLTRQFMLTMLGALFGGPFLYGYNMGVVNTPSPLIREFYTKVYGARAGLYPFAKTNNTSQFGANSNQTDEKFLLKALEAQLGIEVLWTLTIAICLIGGMIGAFASGWLADKLGRKRALLANQTVSIIGAFLFAIVTVTNLPELMLIGRFLVGVSSGVGLGLAPLYLSELSTQTLRGPATSACHLAVTFGIFVSQFLGLSALLGTQTLWPFLFAVVGLSSCFTLVVLPFCPESPRFMLTARSAGYQDVLPAYSWLYGASIGESEAISLCKELSIRGQSRVNLSTLSSPLTQPTKTTEPSAEDPSIKNAKVCFTLAENDNEVCINPSAEKNCDCPTSTPPPPPPPPAKPASTVTFGQLLCSEEYRLPIFLALWLHVTQQWSGINAVMSYSGSIFIRIMPANLVQYAVLSTGMASCLSTAVMLPFMSRLGRRSVVLVSCAIMAGAHGLLTLCGALGSSLPALNYLSIVFVIVYICGYAGTGCTPAILVSEMFLQNARAIAMSLAIATRWGSSFVLLLAFPYMSEVMGVYVFLVFAVVCLLSLVLFALWLHETRGKPAVQIHDQLAHGFEHVQFHVHMPHMPHLHVPHYHLHHHSQHQNQQGHKNGTD